MLLPKAGPFAGRTAQMSVELRKDAAAPLGAGRPQRIHLVWTRIIDDIPMAGRIKVAQGVRRALREAGFSITESTIRPLTKGPTLRRLAAAFGGLLAWSARGRLMPLQCLLFGDRAEARRVIAELPDDCDAVYLDGVRCLQVLEALRRRRPGLAILTDLDDLMSRRMSLLLQLDQPPSTGYMKGSLPGFVDRLIAWRWLSRLLLRYEAASLRQVEKHVARHSDATVLISSADAAELRRLAPGADVRAIAIAEKVRRDNARLAPGPLRFIFVGTDALRQNQLSIDALVDLWRRQEIPTPLVIYGLQHRQLDLPANVLMPGYAESIDDIYDGRSVLVSPSFIAGGLKTKVLEAFAYAAPVIGNRVTFESIDIGADYPLLLETEDKMLSLLRSPERFRPDFERAAAIGLDLVRQRHDPTQIGTSWAEAAHGAIARSQVLVYKHRNRGSI